MPHNYECYFCKQLLVIDYTDTEYACNKCMYDRYISAFSLSIDRPFLNKEIAQFDKIRIINIRFKSILKSISLYFDSHNLIIWERNCTPIKKIIRISQAEGMFKSILLTSPNVLENKIKNWILFS